MAGAAFWGHPEAAVDLIVPEDRNPWEVVVMAGTALPGRCEVKGIAQLAVDTKKASGVDGAAITITGYQPGPFEVACTVWTEDHWTALQAIVESVWKKPKKRARLTSLGDPKQELHAIDIAHPALQPLNITKCVVTGVTIAEATGDGLRTVRFRCQEWVKPSKKQATRTAKAAAPTIVDQHRFGPREKNAPPAKPSDNMSTFTPGGQSSPPSGGSY